MTGETNVQQEQFAQRVVRSLTTRLIDNVELANRIGCTPARIKALDAEDVLKGIDVHIDDAGNIKRLFDFKSSLRIIINRRSTTLPSEI